MPGLAGSETQHLSEVWFRRLEALTGLPQLYFGEALSFAEDRGVKGRKEHLPRESGAIWKRVCADEAHEERPLGHLSSLKPSVC